MMRMIGRHSPLPPSAAYSLPYLLLLAASAASTLFFFFPATITAHPCQSTTCNLPSSTTAFYGPSYFLVSYPFATALGCGASPAFLLQNCSSSSSSPSPVLWTGFQQYASVAAPYVTGIWKQSDSSGNNNRSYVNLTWISPLSAYNLSHDVCDPPSFTNDFAPFLPPDSPSIFLDRLGFEDAISFSEHTHFLLLNCALPNLPGNHPLLQSNSSFCQTYVRQCNVGSGVAGIPSFQAAQCIELQLNGTQNINFTDLISTSLARNQCTHFQMLVQKDSDVNGTAGMLQLTWLDDDLLLPPHDLCKTCEKTQGTCGYDTANISRLLCVCSPANNSTTSGCSGEGKRSKAASRCGTGCEIGIAAGVVMACLAMAVVLFFGCHRYRLLQKRRGIDSRGIPLPVPVSSSNSSNKLFTERARSLSTKFGPVHVKEFSYEDLVKATDSFSESNMIGDGGFGAVYLGVLNDRRRVAIKRLYHDHFRRMDQFYNEMKILSSFSHPNLVKLYGFCCQDDKDLLLVFEYAAKGTVWDHLHGGSFDAGGGMNGRMNSAPSKLPWPIRLRIACETAEALSYLHSDVKPPIYHRDVKTCNILLDDWMHVKVADFGLSRLVPMNVTHVTTAPQGTPGYVDPDYHKCYQLTDKSDVYSFGVVLAELVSGQLAVDMERQRGEINLSSLALSKIGSGRWKDLVDPAILTTEEHEEDGGKTEEMVKAVLELAFTCLQEEKEDRPTMKQVSESLTEIGRRGGFDFKNTAVIPEEVDEMRKLIGNGGADSTDAPSYLSSDVHSPASSLFGNF